MKIYIDGSGFNGFESKFCVVFEDGKSIIKKFNTNKTNNEMEYEALIYALENCNNNSMIYTDSQLIINQVQGSWKVKQPHLLSFKIKSLELTLKKNVKLEYVQRDKNLAGNLLE